jgi:hypothetical protein
VNCFLKIHTLILRRYDMSGASECMKCYSSGSTERIEGWQPIKKSHGNPNLSNGSKRPRFRLSPPRSRFVIDPIWAPRPIPNKSTSGTTNTTTIISTLRAQNIEQLGHLARSRYALQQLPSHGRCRLSIRWSNLRHISLLFPTACYSSTTNAASYRRLTGSSWVPTHYPIPLTRE